MAVKRAPVGFGGSKYCGRISVVHCHGSLVMVGGLDGKIVSCKEAKEPLAKRRIAVVGFMIFFVLDFVKTMR